MAELMLSEKDLKQLESRGVSKKQVEAQIRRFEHGFPHLNIVKAADEEEGVKQLNEAELNEALQVWSNTLKSMNTKVVKFVPASGAASRMFKDLYAFLNGGEKSASVQEVLDNIDRFAFYDALNRACMLGEGGKGCQKLIQIGEERTVIEYLLTDKGLNYGHLPKALLLFHRYQDTTRTATEEQLSEGARYARNADGTVNVHFTLSPEHIEPFETLLSRRKGELEERNSVIFNVTYSTQRKETDTVAVDMDNNLLRDQNGSIIFRPGGHGALIYNLNEINADVIFIKNIDNIVPQVLSCDSIIYKKALGGVLIQLRDQVYKYMSLISDDKRVGNNLIEEIREFLHRAFSIDTSIIEDATAEEQVTHLRRLLNRPLRVCGMVRNEGEPGGGPYITKDANGFTGLQILESTQINKEDTLDMEIFENSRFFNPVDLVLAVKDYRGKKFDLLNFVDGETGFISHKSQEGRELKALELPGLWNGAMSDWLTAFVAVPATTFNPVKTVNDLLRSAHTLVDNK